ncbi:glucosaminidase domain-containing protein [Staphylococcus agnetis]|uniref:Glucosaminidase domain-containing protein n=1 Tax=Staphylococcus agnetis TaxID=985762 RepID=A0ABD7TUR9_9STAP|nr:glucosaminidase domain-containing protein [Staphylococcus agnetis]UXU56801.1 glucosaminidase domain-containing protein [Staphylococcus agnetis]
MGLPNPRVRKPTASEVAAWAKSNIGKRIDIDGYRGSQCWDTPNYIFKRYWGFITWGNAMHMAFYKYPRGFKFYPNTASFIPKPGDIAVWGKGSFNNGTGHTAIVVGPSNKSYFYSVDQNWRNSNGWTGSPGSLEKHSYYGVTGFVRPPYHPDPIIQPTPPSPSEPPEKPKNKDVQVKPKMKEVKKVQYTSFSSILDQKLEYIDHKVAYGNLQPKPKGIYVKESSHMRSVQELYLQRNKYIEEGEYPHVYVDRERVWTPRDYDREAPQYPGWLVIEVCGGQTEGKRQFMLNQIRALIYGVWMLGWTDLKLSRSSLKVDPNIWRTMKDLVNYDLIKNGIPDQSKYDEVEKKIIQMYLNKDKLMSETITTTTTKMKVKVKSNTTVDTPSTSSNKSKPSRVSKPSTPQIVVERSPYTFHRALDLQMARGGPQKSYSWGWGAASRSETSKYMNPNTIWNNSTQRYQMLNLGKYQGIPVDKLNVILKGKGTLSGQGKAFAEGCKKYNINEIYLIAHALLESGNGRSYFASGSSGVYNYFGIGAFDNNPNNAIPFARSRGWTTPAKAIIGGAKFVRQDYIDKGQNTLYRMRWNPKNPATHQYATAIEWCHHQANNISYFYKSIGLKGQYYVQDKYR